METNNLVEDLRALSRQVKGWLDARHKAREIVCGRDRDHLSFLLTTKNAFERVYVALLLDHGHAAEALKQLYDAILAALSQSEIDDPQGWADTVLSSCGDLMLRCHGLAKEMEAEAVRGVSEHLAREAAAPRQPKKRRKKMPTEYLKQAREEHAAKELARNPKITARELGEILGCDASTVVRLEAWKKRTVLYRDPPRAQIEDRGQEDPE